MGLEIIAEYVENSAVRAKVKGLGVDFAQGYGIERPIELTEMLSGRFAERTKARA
jgi:EAL domain-containing protein (putative c-di-GMP-specific phosphodiesterase class I)